MLSKFNHFDNETLPLSIGDPLELLIVKNNHLLDGDFFTTLNNLLTIDIGPSPQQENFLNLIEVDQENFKGILRRHQNILIVSSGDTFNIQLKMNLFALNQVVIFIKCPSTYDLKEKENEIVNLIQTLKKIEIQRLSKKFKQYPAKSINQQIINTHNISLLAPKDFFLAYSDSVTTWIRRETPKISQGIFLTNLNPKDTIKSKNSIISLVDSIIQIHISGPVENSYMTSEKDALIEFDTVKINGLSGRRIQSLWRMENDFMGGVFNAYYFTLENRSSPLLIYTYLYAPGEKKSILLLQLETIINTISLK